jgi:hypothetical protein
MFQEMCNCTALRPLYVQLQATNSMQIEYYHSASGETSPSVFRSYALRALYGVSGYADLPPISSSK